MKTNLIVLFITQLLGFLSPETIKKALDSALEFIEEKINSTETELDNATVIPIMNMIRTTLGVIETNTSNHIAIQSSTAIMLTNLLNSLFSMLSPELIKGFVDKWLDALENMIQASETTIDDSIVIPIITMIRTTFDIPDND